MDVDSREGQYEERSYREEAMYDLEENDGDMEMEREGYEGSKDKERSREPRKHKSKDRKKEHRSKDREKSKEREKEDYIGKDSYRYDTREKERVESSRERRKEDRHEYGRDKEYDKDQHRDKERSRDKAREKEKNREKEHNRDRDLDWEHERVGDRGKDRGREREKDREAQRERESLRDFERGKDREKLHDHMRDRDRDHERSHDKDKAHDKNRARERDYEKEVEKERVKEKDHDRGKDREKDRERVKDKGREKEKIKDREKEDKVTDREREKLERSKDKEKSREKDLDRSRETDHDKLRDDKLAEAQATSELEERLIKMKQERLKRKSDDASEILSWVSKSRKLEEKRNVEREKAARISKILEEQDNIEEEREDEAEAGHSGKDLAGVKILHGIDKVLEGGAVVLTLKDQTILADGDINEEVDMLENVEIGEQRQRDEAHRAAKKKTGIYEDKFSEDGVSRRTILPHYDDPVEDEGVTLDESGRFTGEAEKKLEELRKRIEGNSVKKGFEDLTSSGKTLSDYYTPDEMLQFKKPKKKKSLRKREKLDLDALEAEAISAGLGAGDLGSRKDSKRQLAKEEEAKAEAEMRSSAYQAALAKAEEASKTLRQEQTLTVKVVEDDDLVFGEDYEDLEKSLEQARKLALKRKEEKEEAAAASGPLAVALLATANREQQDIQSSTTGEPQENRVVITEMEEFVLGLQFNEETHKPESEDVFKDEDISDSAEHEMKAEVGGWTEIKETIKDEQPVNVDKVDIGPDEIIHEVAVGKGLSGALKLLKERGTLNEGIDWGGRNMDKKKSKLIGITDDTGAKDIHIERTDEFGRIMTPKEAFRMISHKFHGKGPGKMKQEKRMKQYQEDLKTKQMKASDTPSLTMERMREAQARLKTPYLVLSGHVKPGQTSDPRSGFATVEKDHLGSLTPMLGDKKVEHFLGINRKPESGNMGPPPKKLKS